MKLRTSLVLFSFIGLVGGALLVNRIRVVEPNPGKEAAQMRALLQGLANLHYQPKEINDKFSKELFDYFLKELDGGKRFFIQADVQRLRINEFQIDDQIMQGAYDFLNLSVDILDGRVRQTQLWYQEILAVPLDFSRNETIETDGKKLDWAKDEQDLRARWERWMKFEVLSRVTDELAKQEKPDFKGEVKTFEALERAQREKVLDVYNKWYKRMLKATRSDRVEMYLNALTNVFDPHTGYYSPKDKANFDIQMSGKLEGIGARLQSDGEKTSVTEIVTGGPAWKEGSLSVKDVIVRVGQGEEELVDVMGLEIDDVVSKIRGPKGTVVTLVIQKADGSEKVIKITRDVVLMEEGFAKSLILGNLDNSQKLIGYIYLPKFYADFTPQGSTSCAADVAVEIEKLKAEAVSGIILDLRGNGGGSLRDVVQMSGLFIEEGPIVQVKNRSKTPEIMRDNDSRVQWSGPLVVMVNSFSASASEILAAAMQDYQRAVIVGSASTYGKGTVQRFLDLDNAAREESVKPLGDMKLTIQKFYRISGRTTQLDGVKPDIVLPDFYNYMELGERENDYPLQSNTIAPISYQQNVYRLGDLSKLKSASNGRVSSHPTFKKVEENAVRMRKQKDQTSYPLEAGRYKTLNRKQDEEAERFEDIFKSIEGFKVINLEIDALKMVDDTSKIARNNNWIKEKQKDIQLHEAFLIIQDMIRVDALSGRQ